MSYHTEWSPELAAALAEPFPRDQHAQKDRKGTFVSVRFYVQRLNELVGPGGWSMEQPLAFHSGEKLGLAVGVTVLGVAKWNVGDEMEDHGEPDEDGKVRDFGSSSTNSWAQSFKRCCAYGFGLGLYLYDKDWTRQYLQNGGPRPVMQQIEGAPTSAQTALMARLLKSSVFTTAEREKIAARLAKENTKAKAGEIIDWLTAAVKERKAKVEA